MNKGYGISLVAATLVLLGCQKSYELRFQGVSVPDAQQEVKLAYSGTANIFEKVGVVRQNDTMKYVFRVDEDDLPGTLTWVAGPMSGKILLDKNTSSPILIPVDQHAPGMKVGGQVKMQRGQEPTVEKTETVVSP